MLFPELEDIPPARRMSRFLELSFEYRTSTPAELAEKLGYRKDSPSSPCIRYRQLFQSRCCGCACTLARSGMPG